MRIFLSYGHDDYASLAVRIKRDLKALGHEVWFDLDRLTAGRDWERYIEDGLEFASAVPDAGRFLLLMTPRSVRRPDGFCLNELARAFLHNLPVIPVMVSTVEPPLSICRLQWLDMRNCYPAEQHEEQYGKQLGTLVTALEEQQVPFQGVQQRLLNYLQPISYEDDLHRHLLRFTGREWLMTEVKAWLASSRRMLWITGEAGVGKSAFAAWLCDKRTEIAAYHFCHFGNGDRTDARKALFSLAYQLSTQVSAYQDWLNASPLEKIVVETNVLAVFDHLFIDLLKDRLPLTDKHQVLLIDALDEATQNDRNELASLIGSEFDRLPPWLRVIVTSRPHEKEINFALQALDPWKLDAGRPENVDDIRKYLCRELRPFAGDQVPSDEVVNTIVDKSEGLFLYVSWLRQELEDGRLSLDHIDQFPRGLGGVHADSFQRYFPDPNEYASNCRPALEAICAAHQPLERCELASLLGRSEYEMRALTARLGSLFPTVDGRVRPFHQSVRDWLTNPDRSGDYYIDINIGENRLADFAWRQYKSGVSTMTCYCMTFAPSHLAAYERQLDLKELLLDPDWIQAKLRAAGVVTLLADYDLYPDDSDLNRVKSVLRLSAHVLSRSSSQLASQLTGRLLSVGSSSVREMLSQVRKRQQGYWTEPLNRSLAQADTALVWTFEAHSDYITSLAVTPDGRHAVSGSNDHTLKIWELATGREVHTLAAHSQAVSCVAVTPDGRHAVSGSGDHTLKIWELATGREVRTLAAHSQAVSCVAVTPDGRHAVSGSDDHSLKIWELATGREVRTLAVHSQAVSCVAVTPDGLHVVSGSGRSLKVWDFGAGLETSHIRSCEIVDAVAITSDGYVVSGGEDSEDGYPEGCLLVHSLASGECTGCMEGHPAPPPPVNAIALVADGEWVLWGSESAAALYGWRLGSAESVHYPAETSVTAIGVTPDGRYAACGSERGMLSLYEIEKLSEGPSSLREHFEPVTAVAITPDGRYAASVSADKLALWDVSEGYAFRTLGIGNRRLTAVAVTPDCRHVVFGCEGGGLDVTNLVASGGGGFEEVWLGSFDFERKCQLAGHAAAVSALAVTPDGRYVVSASDDGTLKLWDTATGREVRTLTGHGHAITGFALVSDRWLVSGSTDGSLKIWDLVTGREVRTLAAHSQAVSCVAVTQDGRHAISGSDDHTLKIWELATGQHMRTLDGHDSAVSTVAVTPDGRHVVSGSTDRSLRVWDLDTGLELCAFLEAAPFTCCAVTPDGTRFVVGDWDGRLHILRFHQI